MPEHLEIIGVANYAKRVSIAAARAAMDYFGVDANASTREEGRLVNNWGDGKDGKRVHTVSRTPMVPVVVGNGNEVQRLRLVENRLDYYIKRPFIPKFLGKAAFGLSSFTSFYMERFVVGADDRLQPVQTPGDEARVSDTLLAESTLQQNALHSIKETGEFIELLTTMATARGFTLPFRPDLSEATYLPMVGEGGLPNRLSTLSELLQAAG